tara:strand:- start:93 stop:236 length:144 start_codon:yes stop_codon:yes gene_type:complete
MFSIFIENVFDVLNVINATVVPFCNKDEGLTVGPSRMYYGITRQSSI